MSFLFPGLYNIRERERERETDPEAKGSNSATLTTHRVAERAVKEMNKQ